MTDEVFTIKVGDFAGPLHALLELVEKRKLPINEVSLAEITDEYVAYTREQEASAGQTAQFLVVAATLLLIKSKALLPQTTLEPEEEEAVSDLQQRLALHQIYSWAHRVLGEHMKGVVSLGVPKAYKVKDIQFAPGDDVSLDTLTASLEHIISEFPQTESHASAAIESTVSIKEMMQRITKRITQSDTQDLHALASNREELLVTFLALLELVKDGVIVAHQDERDDISIRKADEV